MTTTVRATRFDGWRVAYETRGEGDRAIVFLHGWSANRRHWRHQLRDLRTDRRLVAIDLLGHGESDKPRTVYSWDLLAGGVAAVLDDAGVRRAVLVGHSNGVPVAHACLSRDPGRIEALVAVDGPFRLSIPPAVLAWMRAAVARPDAATFLETMAAQTPLAGLNPDDVQIVKEGASATPVHVMAGGLEGTSDPSTWTTTPIDVPLLVILAKGQKPGFCSEEEQAYVRSLAPHVEFDVWEGASHFLLLQDPGRFNRRIEAFLDTLRAG
jgi:pimeloyl-ACP methyl ester carboxylesterase